MPTADAAAAADAAPDQPAFDRTGCVEGDFTGYRGDLHNHTAYSADFDGPASGTPAAAFALARQNGLDFIAVTDHLNYLTSTEYSQCRASAEAANEPGSFAAICGYEAQFHGHGMFLFAWSLTSFPNSRSEFFNRIEACEECVGQFNHPANVRFPWLDFSYVAAADPSMELLELNGAPDWDRRVGALAEALDLGWRVSPSWNADTHLANWGSGENRTLVYPATSLSREHLRDAMHAHRTAATNDRNAELVLKADGCWMGSSLAGWTSASFELAASDGDAADGFARVVLVGPGAAELGTLECDGSATCAGSIAIDLAPPTWVLAMAYQSDGDRVVTAPIWFAP